MISHLIDERGNQKSKKMGKRTYKSGPVDSVAARVVGMDRAQQKSRLKGQIRELSKQIQRATSFEERERLLARKSKLQKKLDRGGGPSDEALVNKRALNKAMSAMTRAKWESENYQK